MTKFHGERERGGGEGETDRQTDRQTETDRQTDKQTDRDCLWGASLDVHSGKNLFSKFEAPSTELLEVLSVTLVSSVSSPVRHDWALGVGG